MTCGCGRAEGECIKGDLDHCPGWDVNEELDDDELEAAEAMANCSMMPDGQCLQAGSEYCDFECPFRR